MKHSDYTSTELEGFQGSVRQGIGDMGDALDALDKLIQELPERSRIADYLRRVRPWIAGAESNLSETDDELQAVLEGRGDAVS